MPRRPQPGAGTRRSGAPCRENQVLYSILPRYERMGYRVPNRTVILQGLQVIEQVLPANGKAHQAGKAFGRVVLAIHMDVDPTGLI